MKAEEANPSNNLLKTALSSTPHQRTSPLPPQQREGDDVLNARRVRQQHDHSVDAYAQTCGGRHTRLESSQELLVHSACFFIPSSLLLSLHTHNHM